MAESQRGGIVAECNMPIVGEPGPEIYITLCATCKRPMEPGAAGYLCCHSCGHSYPGQDTVPIITSAKPLAIDIYLDGKKIAGVVRKQGM